jgi:hypothetical protein
MTSEITELSEPDRKLWRLNVAMVGSSLFLWSILGYVLPRSFLLFRGAHSSADYLPAELAATGSAAIAVATLFWTTGVFARRFPVASVLLTVGIRMITTGGMAAVSAATKWTEHKTFCFCLLGCYFSFFVLESAFSIARIGYLSRR